MMAIHSVRSALLLLLPLLAASGRCCHADTTELARPNIVMIIADDQGWSDYGFMGHPEIHTPHLDQLAQRSAVFPKGYVPTALCRPSLMTMITGRYPHQHGITGNDPARTEGISNEQFAVQRQQLIDRAARSPMLPQLLGSRGYASHQCGKWWEGSYRVAGFTSGMTRGFPQPGGRHGDDGLEIGRRGLNSALQFVDESAAANRPFFLWYAPLMPHTPHDPPERLLTKYTAGKTAPELARYYAMCEWFDETCGQLLQHLDKVGLTENTLVVYLCDNGWIQPHAGMELPAGWNQPFAPRSKQSPYEGGIRTPVMFAWPNVIIPGNRDTSVSSIDVVPTVLTAAGADLSADLPGLSLLPVLTQTEKINRTFLYGECFSHDVFDIDRPEESLMYRWCIQDQWKLILTYPCQPDRYQSAHQNYESAPQLFDLIKDPHERENLSDIHRSIVSQLAANLDSVLTIEKEPKGLQEITRKRRHD